MSQRIWLIRHGKSARPFGVVDHQRPLSKRADDDATRVREWLKDAPAVFVASTARRAAQTAELIAAQRSVRLHDELYQASLGQFLDVIEEVLADVDHVALVGHNPTITEVVNQLAGRVITDNVPTFGVAAFERGSPAERWSLTDYVVPKQLR